MFAILGPVCNRYALQWEVIQAHQFHTPICPKFVTHSLDVRRIPASRLKYTPALRFNTWAITIETIFGLAGVLWVQRVAQSYSSQI
ncbi:uncharacterized protein FOMMEDRAFT_162543 [Fomitiporia mediterranea MF3/22]|uniref:Uncharacterized protein n=1 Tax=Fomitiporia mediterranea (strain MF3/22) TaxID=694068 RepID=R7SH80_FOMME|nr:uncharacterized protein FOMMEDRAFT_162543 [Fomitiporia mediterranea MF3/22]EJC97735.1 hypothetical protein FOMMEDRAFT_162543 [Fomitiporia mediterranea MF3/22]